MDEQEKLLSIEEVSLQLKVPKHTLRFWEKAFEGILVPQRTPGGQRRYTPENMTTIEEIKELRRKGMKLSDIKRELSNDEKEFLYNLSKIDLLADRIAAAVKAEVYNFFERESR